MFHQYVTNSHGVRIDIDRAMFLADTELWNDAVDAVKAAGKVEAQGVWDKYCVLHEAKYGESFPPDVRKTPL